MTDTIGFVGLGMLGAPMAARLGQTFQTVVYDVRSDAGDNLGDAHRTASIEDLAAQSDVVCLSLPSGTASTETVDRLVSASSSRARMIIELSTIGPSTAERCADVARDAGWSYVDAPVSGGVRPAETGHLSAMLAGSTDDVDAVMPVIHQIADKLFVVGIRPGLGQVMKLVNNAIALAVLPLTSEALTFGASYDLDMQAMLDVINASSGRTQRSEIMFPTSIVTGTFDYGARGEITLKDVGLFVEEARRAGSPVAISQVVERLYQEFVGKYPNTDYSYLHKYIEELPANSPANSAA